MKKNILIVMPSLHSGGAEKSLISLLTALPKGMFDIDLMVVNKGGLFYDMVPDGINVIEAPRSFRISLGKLYEMKSIDWGVKCISNVYSESIKLLRKISSNRIWNQINYNYINTSSLKFIMPLNLMKSQRPILLYWFMQFDSRINKRMFSLEKFSK